MKHFTRFCGSFAAGMLVAAALCSGVCVVAGAQDVPAYRDAKLAVEVRVADLIGRMTLDEKVAQLEGTGEFRTTAQRKDSNAQVI